MNRMRTAPGGAVGRAVLTGRLVLFLAIGGVGCANSDALITSLGTTPVSLAITVVPTESGGVQPTPQALELEIGESVALSATALDVIGQPVNASVQWTVSPPGVANVDAQGMVQAVGAGQAEITASMSGVAATLAVVVTGTP